jgi:hypothetical protein
MFSKTGDYTIEFSTKIIDGALFNSKTETKTASIKILSDLENNYSYSQVLANSGISSMNISNNYLANINYSSYYVNEYGNSTKVNSNLSFNIKDKYGASVYSNTLSGLSNDSYSFVYNFTIEGNYTVEIMACPDVNLGKTQNCSTKVLSVSVIDPNKSSDSDDDSSSSSSSSDNTRKVSAKGITLLTENYEMVDDSKDLIISDNTGLSQNSESTSEKVVEVISVSVIGCGIIVVLVKILSLIL